MFIRRFLHAFLMDQANAGEGGGAGGGAGADPAGSAGAGAGGEPPAGGTGAGVSGQPPAGTEGAGGQGQPGTVLQAGAQGQGQAVAIPEKYQVKKDDGSLDIEASSLKLAEAYGHLEKRLGSGDAPPKSPDEYQITVPDSLKDAWNPKEDEKLQAFLKDAHASGFTQKQVDMAIGKYLEIAPKLVEGSRALSAEECVTTLKQEWKTEDQYKAEVGKAYQAAVAYGGDDADGIIRDYGNDPRIVRMMARIGGELGEDRSLNPGSASQGGPSVESLMASEAYTNAKHPDHARVSAQVQSYFAKQAEAAAKAGNAPIL